MAIATCGDELTSISPAAGKGYSRNLIENWRDATEWQSLALDWLDELAKRHGVEMFRTRKGAARDDVKEICEEVLPLGIWMANYAEVLNWKAKFAARYSKADAWLQSSLSSKNIPLQIVGAFDGLELAGEMKELNSRGRTTTVVKSKTEIEEEHSRLVHQAIAKKAAKEYTSDFWLLVAIDDRFAPLSELSSVVASARETASSCRFEQVHLVGLMGQEAIRVR